MLQVLRLSRAARSLGFKGISYRPLVSEGKQSSPSTSSSDAQDQYLDGSMHGNNEHYIRISPLGRRNVESWTTRDILSFLEDPNLHMVDLSVEYETYSMRPQAWWVRYQSAEKQALVLQGVGGTARLGTTEVVVSAERLNVLDKEAMKRNGIDILQAGGNRVILESFQEMTVDMIESWLAGFQLSNTMKRVRVWQPGQGKKNFAVVVFSDPEEAQLAAGTKHKQMMGAAPVFVRLLP